MKKEESTTQLKDIIFRISRNRNPQTQITVYDADDFCIYSGFPLLSAVSGLLSEEVEIVEEGLKTKVRLINKATDDKLQKSFESYRDFCDDFD